MLRDDEFSCSVRVRTAVGVNVMLRVGVMGWVIVVVWDALVGDKRMLTVRPLVLDTSASESEMEREVRVPVGTFSGRLLELDISLDVEGDSDGRVSVGISEAVRRFVRDSSGFTVRVCNADTEVERASEAVRDADGPSLLVVNVVDKDTVCDKRAEIV